MTNKQCFNKRHLYEPPLSISPRYVSIGRQIAPTISKGFVFGTGSSLAKTMVNNILVTSNHSTDSKNNGYYEKCEHYIKIYEECISSTNDSCSTSMDLIHIYCKVDDFTKLDKN